MSWSGWSSFFAMGGYGFYVWGAYVVALVCLTVEIIWVLHRQRRAWENVPVKQVTASSSLENNETPI